MARLAQSEFSSATNVSRLIFLILAFLLHKIHKTVDIYTMDPQYTLPSIEFVLTMAHLDPLEQRHVHRYHPCFNPAPHVQIHFHEGQRGNTAETVGFCFLLLYIWIYVLIPYVQLPLTPLLQPVNEPQLPIPVPNDISQLPSRLIENIGQGNSA